MDYVTYYHRCSCSPGMRRAEGEFLGDFTISEQRCWRCEEKERRRSEVAVKKPALEAWVASQSGNAHALKRKRVIESFDVKAMVSDICRLAGIDPPKIEWRAHNRSMGGCYNSRKHKISIYQDSWRKWSHIERLHTVCHEVAHAVAKPYELRHCSCHWAGFKAIENVLLGYYGLRATDYCKAYATRLVSLKTGRTLFRDECRIAGLSYPTQRRLDRRAAISHPRSLV